MAQISLMDADRKMVVGLPPVLTLQSVSYTHLDVYKRQMLTLAEHQSPVDDLAFTADGNRLITLDRNGQMRLWDARLQALGERAALSIDPAAFDIALRPDGQQMAIGSAGGPAALLSLIHI